MSRSHSLAGTLDQVIEELQSSPRVPSFGHLPPDQQLVIWGDLIRILYTGRCSERLWHAVHIAVVAATTDEVTP